MIASDLTGVEFIAMNTDAQDLRRSLAPKRFQLGSQLTKDLVQAPIQKLAARLP